MSDERIPDDVRRHAENAAQSYLRAERNYENLWMPIARAILAERNRVHKQLKGEE